MAEGVEVLNARWPLTGAIQSFVGWLKERAPLENDWAVTFIFLDGDVPQRYDVIGGEDYVRGLTRPHRAQRHCEILIGAQNFPEAILEAIAHEWRHGVLESQGVSFEDSPYHEREAEKFAWEAVAAFRREHPAGVQWTDDRRPARIVPQ